MFRKWTVLFAFAALVTAPAIANAGAIGATVALDFYYPDQVTLYCSSGNAVVGGGVEYPSGCSGFSAVSIDIFDDYLLVSAVGSSWSTATFNGFSLSTLLGPDFVSAVYGGGTMGVTGLQIIAGDLWANFEGQAGGVARINFATSNAAVPEPATLSLLGTGMVLAAYRRRRRARTMNHAR